MNENELRNPSQNREYNTDKKAENDSSNESIIVENEIKHDKMTEDEGLPTDESTIEHTGQPDKEKHKELDQLKDAHLRLMAEYDNYRKRTIKEKADLILNGGERVLTELLPIIDDLERAIDTMENKPLTIDISKEGINLIYKKFSSFLLRNGLKRINSIGEEFNPELFEAVATVPAQNEEQKGKIISNVQVGYTLNNKVIRHAKVIVAH